MTDTGMLNWLAEQRRYPSEEDMAELVADNINKFVEIHDRPPTQDEIWRMHHHVFRWLIQKEMSRDEMLNVEVKK